MQYLLTQEEYDALLVIKQQQSEKDRAALQALCTLAAKHVPVRVRWAKKSDPPEPWGCWLDKEGDNCGYCDECPAQKLCPQPSKRWSK